MTRVAPLRMPKLAMDYLESLYYLAMFFRFTMISSGFTTSPQRLLSFSAIVSFRAPSVRVLSTRTANSTSTVDPKVIDGKSFTDMLILISESSAFIDCCHFRSVFGPEEAYSTKMISLFCSLKWLSQSRFGLVALLFIRSALAKFLNWPLTRRMRAMLSIGMPVFSLIKPSRSANVAWM